MKIIFAKRLVGIAHRANPKLPIFRNIYVIICYARRNYWGKRCLFRSACFI